MNRIFGQTHTLGALIVVLVTTVFGANNARAEGACKDIPTTTAAPKVAGSWRTEKNNIETVLSTENVTTARWFSITNSTGGSKEAVRIVVDDNELIYPIHPCGGGALVYGSRVQIKQVPAAQKTLGVWAVLEESQPKGVAWAVVPSNSAWATIGSLDTAREFLVTVDANAANCTDPSIILHVDGKVVDGGSKTRTFLGGTSVIGYGKTISVMGQATCSDGGLIRGYIALI